MDFLSNFFHKIVTNPEHTGRQDWSKFSNAELIVQYVINGSDLGNFDYWDQFSNWWWPEGVLSQSNRHGADSGQSESELISSIWKLIFNLPIVSNQSMIFFTFWFFFSSLKKFKKNFTLSKIGVELISNHSIQVFWNGCNDCIWPA